MDKKIEFAKILSNSIEDDTEEVNKETKLDLIDSLIKDVDLRKNYNSRFNFYINFIKMFQKNSNIIKYIYNKLNIIKNLNEKEKHLLRKLNFAVAGSSNTIAGGYKHRGDNYKNNIEQIIKLIKRSKNKKKKYIHNLQNELKNIIINTHRININKNKVDKLINKTIGGEKIYIDTKDDIKDLIMKTISEIISGEDTSNIDDTDEEKILGFVEKINNNIKDKYGITELGDLSEQIYHSIIELLKIYQKPNTTADTITTTEATGDAGDAGVAGFAGVASNTNSSSGVASNINNPKITESDEPDKEFDDNTSTSDTNFLKVLKVLQKHYELKNLSYFNNKNYADNSKLNNNEYYNSILQFDHDIDKYNEIFSDGTTDKIKEKNNLANIKSKLIKFENNPNNPYLQLSISYEDRLVFIITTFFIRYISLILIQWCVDINIIRSFEEGFIYYAVLYISIFWFFVLFVNIDNSYKIDYIDMGNTLNSIRSLFYYFYMGTNGITKLLVHSSLICVIIFIPVILNIKKQNNYMGANDIKEDTIISYEDRKKLSKSLSLFTIFLWILTSIIATKF